MAQLITTAGKITGFALELGPAKRLMQLQRLVGGYIQRVATTCGRIMLVDEGGRMKQLPVNPEASRIAKVGGIDIVGDVVVLGPHEEL